MAKQRPIRSRRRAAASALAATIALAMSAPATVHAKGRLLFVRGGALWEKPAAGGETQKLATLPEGSTVRGIEATHDGRLVVLDLGGRSAWLAERKLAAKTCAGPARPSPRADELACAQNGTYTLVPASGGKAKPLPAGLHDVNYLGDWPEVAGISGDSVVAVDPTRPGTLRKLLPAKGPRSHLLVAPDATRAVAVCGEGIGARVCAFTLDGAGVPRHLGGVAVPRVWSWDSRWILVQENRAGIDDGNGNGEGDGEGEGEGEGEAESSLLRLERDAGGNPEPDRTAVGTVAAPWLLGAPAKASRTKGKSSSQAERSRADRAPKARGHQARGRKSKRKKAPPPPRVPDTRACVIRAVGGQTKCWNDFEGLGFSPDADYVLLRKENALYQARIAGVRAETPKLLLEDVTGPATWLP